LDVRVAAATPDAGTTAGADLVDRVGAGDNGGLDRTVGDPLAGADEHEANVKPA
jgi:hypothetical protein